MIEVVKAPTVKPDYLSLVPKIHMVKGANLIGHLHLLFGDTWSLHFDLLLSR